MSHARRALAIAAVGLGGCLEVPSEPAPMCTRSADCNTAAGEICDLGVCWGDPPAGAFAAVVSPPSERNATLVTRELRAIAIGRDGWIEDVRLGPTATLRGELALACEPPVTCDERLLGATLTVTRPSSFPGGPGFSAVVAVEPGDRTFELAVPPTAAGDPPYTVTVVPAGRGALPTPGSTAQLVPPLRTQLEVPASASGKVIALGGFGLVTIAGKITDAALVGQGAYRVAALGRWDRDQPLTEVSTVDYTGADGSYRIALSPGLVDNVVIVATPYDPQRLRPTLRLAGVRGSESATGVDLALPTGPAAAVAIDVAVDGVESGGEVRLIAGARVIATSVISTGPNATASLVVEQATDMGGVARLRLLDGPLAASYAISVVPPTGATMGAVFGEAFALGPVALPIRLPNRLALRGIVVDSAGEPVKDVAVTARPATRFLWNLDPAPQAFVSAIPPATATTPATGEFIVWVDPVFDNVFGYYDLVFEPAASDGLARVPGLVQTVELPRDARLTTLSLEAVALPEPAYVRGGVFDDRGEPLDGAEVKLYRVASDAALCTETRNPPKNCPIPATLVGRDDTDETGLVQLTLPR